MSDEKTNNPEMPAPTKINFLSAWLKKVKSRPKYFGAIGGATIIVIILGIWLIPKLFPPAPKILYSVAIVVRSQFNPNPADDLRTSLKAGDVLVVQPADHDYSATEKISYLILKMNLTRDEAAKLTQADEKTLNTGDLSAAEQKRINDTKTRAQKNGQKYSEPPRKETIRPRLYYIDLSKVGFTDPNVLLDSQPYADTIFDWGIVRKK